MMKNEPVISYNHMQEDTPEAYFGYEERRPSPPISIYMILVADVALMGLIGFLAYRFIF